MKCKKCGNNVPGDAKYCPVCGVRADGKVKCPACGKFVEKTPFCAECGTQLNDKQVCYCGAVYVGEYCPECGAPAHSAADEVIAEPSVTEEAVSGEPFAEMAVATAHTEAVVPAVSAAPVAPASAQAKETGVQKTFKIISWALAGAAAALSLIFVLCLGVSLSYSGSGVWIGPKSISIYDYFGKVYYNIQNIYPDFSEWSPDAQFVVCLPYICGTVISAATLAGVVSYAILTAVAYIKKFIYKKDVNVFKPAIITFLIFAAGATAFSILSDTYVNISEYGSYYRYEYLSGGLNSATIGGLLLSSFAMIGFAVSRIICGAKKHKNRSGIINLCVVCVFGFFAFITLMIVGSAPVCIEYETNDISSFRELNFMGIISSLPFNSSSADSIELGVYAGISLVAQFAIAGLLIAIFYKLLTALAEGKRPHTFKLSVSAFAVSSVYLVFAILTSIKIVLMSGYPAFSYEIDFSNIVSAFVFAVIIFVHDILLKTVKPLAEEPAENQ